MEEVRGKIVMITGAAMGMGSLLAREFARDGARMILLDVNQDALERITEEIKELGAEALSYQCDVTDRVRVYEVRDRVHQDMGKIDVLVNNAGVVWGGSFLESSDERLYKTIDVNVNGVMWMTKAFLPDIYEKGKGHVINMASASGLMGVANLVAYSASKFAVFGMTEALRQETKRKKLWDVKFTVVCPSFVSTGMFEGVRPPKMSSWLTPEQMVKKIYRGFKKGKPIVCAPFMVSTIPLLRALTTVRRFDIIAHSLGVTKSMDEWKGREQK